MKLKEYVEQYNEAPLEIGEFAEGALEVTNCESLVVAAEAYLEAYQNLIDTLAKHHVSMG